MLHETHRDAMLACEVLQDAQFAELRRKAALGCWDAYVAVTLLAKRFEDARTFDADPLRRAYVRQAIKGEALNLAQHFLVSVERLPSGTTLWRTCPVTKRTWEAFATDQGEDAAAQIVEAMKVHGAPIVGSQP